MNLICLLRLACLLYWIELFSLNFSFEGSVFRCDWVGIEFSEGFLGVLWVLSCFFMGMDWVFVLLDWECFLFGCGEVIFFVLIVEDLEFIVECGGIGDGVVDGVGVF